MEDVKIDMYDSDDEPKDLQKKEIELKNFEKSNMSYFELEEKFFHYKKTSSQYEALYGEYLEKYIISERDRKLLIYKQRRVNQLVAYTAESKAKWDALITEKKKIAR